MSDLIKATRERDNSFVFGIWSLVAVQMILAYAAYHAAFDNDKTSKEARSSDGRICDGSSPQKSIKNTLNRLSQGNGSDAGETYYSTTKLSNGKKVTMSCVSYKMK